MHELGKRRIARRGLGGPDQRDRLGQVSDEVVGQCEKFFVHPFGRQPAKQRWRDHAQIQIAGERPQGQAPFRVGTVAEMGDEMADFAVALGREGKRFEQPGKVLHASASSS